MIRHRTLESMVTFEIKERADVSALALASEAELVYVEFQLCSWMDIATDLWEKC